MGTKMQYKNGPAERNASKPPEKRDYMRLSEVFKHTRNKFIRQNHKMLPEVDQKESEEKETTEDTEKTPNKKAAEKDRMIRKYRAYAYHHKKKRIRKKYLKKLMEISLTYRIAHFAGNYGVTSREASIALNRLPASPGKIGSRKEDHPDRRLQGGVR